MTCCLTLRRLSLVAIVMGAFIWLGAVKADVDPKVASYINLSDIKWNEAPNGSSASYLISGDPTKEGSLYVQLMKWHAHHNSTPISTRTTGSSLSFQGPGGWAPAPITT